MSRKNIPFTELKPWEQMDIQIGRAKAVLEDIRRELRKTKNTNWYIYGISFSSLHSYIADIENLAKGKRR